MTVRRRSISRLGRALRGILAGLLLVPILFLLLVTAPIGWIRSRPARRSGDEVADILPPPWRDRCRQAHGGALPERRSPIPHSTQFGGGPGSTGRRTSIACCFAS
jgi:hypothetical protein